MSTRNTSYLKSNFTNHPSINIQQREKSASLSPHRMSSHRRTPLLTSFKNEELPSTEAKRNRENDEDYSELLSRSIYQQKTNKKSLYPKQPPLNPTTNYVNNTYQPTTNTTKMQLIKQQNVFLTQENNHLNELLIEKNKVITNLEKKLEYQIQQEVITLEQIEREKNKFLADFHLRDDEQRVEIQRLVIELQHSGEEIACLKLQKDQAIRQKDAQIQILKATYTQKNRQLIDNVIAKKDADVKSLQNRIADMTSTIQKLSIQLRTLTQSSKATEQHLNNQISKLLSQLENVNHEKKILLSEQKIAFDNIVLSMSKEKQQEINNIVFKYEMEIKKYKNLLNEQILNNNTLENKVQSAELEHTNQIQKRINGESQLKHEIYEIKNFYQQKHQGQISKEKTLYSQQNEMINKAMQLKGQEYEQDLKKLIAVNRQNKAEIERLYNQIQILRAEKKEQTERLQKINNQLKQKIAELSQSHQQQVETLKIKLGQLRHADITGLKQYYENELASKSQQIVDMEKMIKENRDKLHKELQDKLIERKHHQRQIDDLRIKIGELELRIAMITQEHKEKIHSMGSQMQLASMTLIQETSQKQKYSKQSQAEKKNLQSMIDTKDEEIQQLNSKMVLIKKAHTEEIEQKEQTILILQEKNDHLNEQIKRERQFYQKEIQKKEQLKKQTKEYYQMQIQREKETYSKEFTEVTERLMNEKNQLNIRVEHLQLVEKELREELALHAEHHEQRTLEKEVSHHQEKARLQYSKQSLEINLKNYYEKKISEVQQELKITKQQLAEKTQDVRTLTEKNHKLQKKIDKIMESQEKMRVLQEKVMALGQENNLVKNVAQLSSKAKRKPA